MLLYPFATQVNFLDPKSYRDEDGNELPYGPKRLKDLIWDCYIISKNSSNSYEDVKNMTPIEKNYIIQFIVEEAERTKERLEQNRREMEQR